MSLAELVDRSHVGVGWPRSSKRGAALLFSAESALDPDVRPVNQFRENHLVGVTGSSVVELGVVLA
jgi:hypothetical protein